MSSCPLERLALSLLQLEQLDDVFAPAVATTAAVDNNAAAVVPDVDVELNSLVNSIILE